MQNDNEYREALAGKKGRRLRFQATFVRTGVQRDAYTSKPDGGDTLLFRDITYRGTVLCDHIWMPYAKVFRDLGPLVAGDVLTFEAGVGSYTRGYRGRNPYVLERSPPMRTNYHLVNPRDAEFVARSMDAREDDEGVRK